METLYTGHIHGFPPSGASASAAGSAAHNVTMMNSIWDEQSGLVALGVVLGSSISLVGLAFAFITYSLFSDLRSLAGTALLSFLASLFMGQLFFVIGVGGIQDTELCISLSMAQLFMNLASVCWMCCCCHHSLTLFRKNSNLVPSPEVHMGKSFAHYSLLSWGFPLLMVAVALAFKYSEQDQYPAHSSISNRHNQMVVAEFVKKLDQHNNHHRTHAAPGSAHCWLMEGPPYIWGFLIPVSILLLLGLWLAAQGGDAVKITAGLQVDSRTRNKLLKRRGLQIGLFIKLLILLSSVVVLGALASLWGLSELWALYSIVQGVQGIVTALLVTCNCRVLKLYTAPRQQHRHKQLAKKASYKCLRDCEKSHFGVLSITNPNYESSSAAGAAAIVVAESPERNSQSTSCTNLTDNAPHFVKMSYREDNVTIDLPISTLNYSDNNCDNSLTDSSVKTIRPKRAFRPGTGELSGALSVAEIPKRPLPRAV